MATLSGRTLNGNSGKQTYKYDGVINSKINAGGGNDVFRLNFARNSTLNGDAGNDNIKIEWQKSTNKVRVNGGAGNDTIDVDGSVSTVDGGAGNDSISVKGSSWSVNGGAGNDTIQLWGWDTNLTVSGGAGKDTFLLMGPRYNDAGKPITATWATITDLSAEDTLRFAINPEVARAKTYAKGKKNPFYGKDGKISSLTATRSGSTVTLKDSEYRVNLVLKNITDLSRLGSVKVLNGSKAKKATTLRSLIKISKLPKGLTTKGSQLVIANTFKGTFDFGKYFSWAKNINASSSKQKLTIKGDAQKNTITAGSAASVLYGLGGNDKLTGGKANDKLYGGAGNDNLNGNAGNDYLYGEAGNDVLTGGAGNDTFVYRNDGSKDTIKDYGLGTDTFYIASGTVSKTAISGKNFVFTIGKGTATLANAASKTVTVKTVGGTYTMNKTTLTAKSGFGGTLNGNFSTVKTVNGAAATKATTLYGSSIANTITGGSGNDKLYGYAGNDTLKGGAGNDYLDGGAGDDSLIGGVGNDSLYGGAGNDTFYYDSGNDTIYDYEEDKDIIRFGSTTVSFAEVNGNDGVLKLFNGSTITLKGAKGKKIDYLDSSGEVQSVIIQAPIQSTNGNDNLDGSSGDDVMNGGEGNDTMTGGKGKDTFVYMQNEGNDVITDYTEGQDILHITSGTITETALTNDDKDIVFTVGSGTLTLQNAGTKTISLQDSRGSYTLNNTELTLGTDFGGTLDAAKYLPTITTLDGSASTKKMKLCGNDNASTIKGGSANDEIYGLAGNDVLYGGKGSDYLSGGTGDDTLYGGEGQNTLAGGYGEDRFCVSSDDEISDYESGVDIIDLQDGLYVTSGTNHSTNSRNTRYDVVLSLARNGNYGGAIVLRGAVGKEITCIINGVRKKVVVTWDDKFSISDVSPMIANSAAPIVGTSSAQLASLVSTTQTGSPGGLTNTGLASPEASGSSLIAAGGGASNPLTSKKTA